MAKVTTDTWIFHTHRPNMRIYDINRNAMIKTLMAAVEDDTIHDHPRARRFPAKFAAHLSLDHTPKEMEEMLVAMADEDGDFITKDPVVANLINKELEKSPEINHPLTKKAFKFELDKISPPVPTDEEVAKILSKKTS